MVLSTYSQQASPLQRRRSNRLLSDLSSHIRIFHECRDGRTLQASNEQGPHEGFYHASPVACERCVDSHPSTVSVQEDGLKMAQDEEDDEIDDNNKSATIERMCRNIHRKRHAWQQIALRCRHTASPHQATLQILKEAFKRAKAAAATLTEEITNSSAASDESIPANAFLQQILDSATTVQTGCKTTYATTIDLETVATKLQPSQLSSSSHLERPAPIERQCSDITMSDFGDSAHHPTFGGGTRRSLRDPSRWIQEGKVEESSDDDDDDDRALHITRYGRNSSTLTNFRYGDEFRFDPSRRINLSRRLDEATNKHTSKNSRAKRFQVKEKSSPVMSSFHASPTERDSWQWQQHSWSSLPIGMNPSDGDIRVTYSMGHSSYSSYFIVGSKKPQRSHGALLIQDQEQSSATTGGTASTITRATNKAQQSGSQRMDDYIESLLEDDVEDDHTTDDVSLAESFFEENPLIDKDENNILHRSDGSLDFRSTLKKKSSTFRDLKGKIPTSCFHLSLSTSSRWDGGLPDPTTVSQLPQHDQVAVAKAAISTYLPVRPPPRKLTPTRFSYTPSTGSASDSNHINNNSLSTIFSSMESTEPSPQMPLRKASTHGSSHFSVNGKVDELVSKLSLPHPPPTTGRSGRPSTTLTESSPQLPIRKASSHHSEHSTQPDSNAMLSVGGASPPNTADTPSMRRMRKFISTSGPILEDGPIRQPERKSSSLVVVLDNDDDLPLESQDGVKMSTILDSPLTVMDDHPIRLPVRKLSALTLNSSTHHSSQTPPRPPNPSQQDVVSSINDKR